ncbi:MAG TPA: PaaI family thioesterase [Phenylobacterium sp.]|nr:PaaI family thioesterase [Phenylobacterium sp.]
MTATKSHTITWDVGPDDDRPKGLAGLEAMRLGLEAGRRRRTPIAALMDFDLVSAEPGVAVLEGRPGAQHYNPIGVVHGGFAATLLDAALWSAVNTTIEPGQGHTTLELKVNYSRPMTTQTGPVTCEARVVHRGGRIAIAEARISDAAGKLYAYGSSTLMIDSR